MTGRRAVSCSRRRQGTKLHAALDSPWVAFEIDGLDPDGTGGWSVLVVGRGREPHRPGRYRPGARTRTVLWGADRGVHWVRIVPSKVTGRRIRAVVG